MLNRILFPKKYTFNFPSTDFEESSIRSVFLGAFLLKDDPFLGISVRDERSIKEEFLVYKNANNVFVYYTDSFLKISHSFKFLYPYFKGVVTNSSNGIVVDGRLKYQTFFAWVFLLAFAGVAFFVIEVAQSKWFLSFFVVGLTFKLTTGWIMGAALINKIRS